MALPHALVKAVPLSKQTELAAALSAVGATLYIRDDDAGRDQDGALIAPVRFVIGRGADAEEVECPSEPVDRVYSTVTRGVGGTTAKAWPAGTPVARRLSATDWDDMVADVVDCESRIATLESAGPGGSGDVVGPASATDNAVVRFDTTTGKLVQNSAVTIADTTGTVSINEHAALADPTASPTGKFAKDDGTWSAPPAASTSAAGYAPQATAPAAGDRNYVGIANGETVYTNKALFSDSEGNPAALGVTDDGTSTYAARRDHVHDMPAIDTLDAATDITTLNATTSAHGLAPKAVAPATTNRNFLGIANGETTFSNKPLFTTDSPANLGATNAGTSLYPARVDHVHLMPAFDDLSDVDLTGVATGAIVAKGIGGWVVLAPGITPNVALVNDGGGLLSWSTLSATFLSDMEVSGPMDGQILEYDVAALAFKNVPHDHSAQFLDILGVAVDAERLGGKLAATFPTATEPWIPAPSWSRLTDSVITFTNDPAHAAVFKKGRPVRFRATGGTWRYAIITTATTTSAQISGHALTTSDDDEMQFADMSRVVQVPIFIPGTYEDASDATLIKNDADRELTWGQGTAYLVRARARAKTVDSGNHEDIVIYNDANSTTISLSPSANGAWVNSETYSAAGYASYYEYALDAVIEVGATTNGNGDASDLTVQLTFVLG